MRNFEEKELPQLLDLLYDAALDPQRWPVFLNGLPAAFGGACGVLHDFDIASARLAAYSSFGSDPAYIASYGEYYGYVNPYPAVGFAKFPVGKPLLASDCMPPEIAERSEFYNDWMKPQGITTDHLAVPLSNSQGKVTILSIAPHARVYHKDRKTYRRRLELLVPHLIRAVAINRTAVRAQRAESALATGLDALSLAAFLVSENGQVLLANGGAEELLRRERVLIVDRSRRLSAADPAAYRSFAAAIAQAFLPMTARIAPPVRLTCQATGRVFIAWALPMRPTREQEQNSRMQLANQHNGRGNEAVLVLVASADRGLLIHPEVIQAAFQLSAAEARLASALVAGRTLAEYARENELSRNTARNQLASTLEKTGLHRQTELVSLIAGALGTLSRR